MRTVAILPVKSLGSAKRRLAPCLDAPSRRELARAMSQDVLAALASASQIDRVVVVTPCPALARAARASGAAVLADSAGGYSGAAALGLRHAVASGADRAFVVPADVPLLAPAAIDRLLARAPAAGPSVTVVPDRRGEGTNGLLLHPPDVIDPAYGPGSCARHLKLAEAAGAARRLAHVTELALDVDTPADLELLARRLSHSSASGGETRAALRALARSGRDLRPPPAPAVRRRGGSTAMSQWEAALGDGVG